jgi:hypothetical protein
MNCLEKGLVEASQAKKLNHEAVTCWEACSLDFHGNNALIKKFSLGDRIVSGVSLIFSNQSCV